MTAAAWIKMRTNLWDDPRVSRLCDLTGATEAAIVGCLYWVWATADEHSVDGVLHGQSLTSIDRKTRVKGFASAMVDVGWIEDTPHGVRVPRFDEHNGASAKRRALDAQLKAKSRHSVEEMSASEPDICETLSGHDAVLEEEEEKEKKEEIPPSPLSGGGVLGFGRFWKAYPGDRKAAKRQCFDKWQRKGFEPIADTIVAHVEVMAQSDRWREEKGRYIPAPLVYLNQTRWEAGAPPPPVSNAPPPYVPPPPMTPEERAKSDEARRLVMSTVKRIAA